jgi:hypothetical protein
MMITSKRRGNHSIYIRRSIVFVIVFLSVSISQAQEIDFSKIKPGGVKFHLTEDSSSFFRFFGFTHIWARYMQMNPGTVDKAGNPMKSDFDIGIRRNRSGFYFNLFDNRFISFIQFGMSAQTYASEKRPQVFFIDLATEYALVKEKFHLGYGLHSWNGVARQSNVSSNKFLYLDNPGFSYPLVGTFDQSGRQLGIYAKGLINDFQYRVSFSKPFSYSALNPIQDTLLNTAYEYHNTNYTYKGYLNWQFLENENDPFPWKTMNHLGKKRLFNVGAGFHYHPETMKSYSSLSNAPAKHDLLMFGVDAFLELPHPTKSSAYTGYLVYYNYDFGPNYLKKGGLMNTGTGGAINGKPLLQGGGNSRWAYGTGDIIHFETGYLFPKMEALNNNQFQIFGGYTYKNLEGLGCPLHEYDMGINYFLYGNHIKCSIQYSARPIYKGSRGENASGSIAEYKGTVIFNTQIDI